MLVAINTIASFVLDSDDFLPSKSSFELGCYSIKKPPYMIEGAMAQMVVLHLPPRLL
jgi:hypothetical protein